MKAESAAGDETVHIDIAIHASLHTNRDLPQDGRLPSLATRNSP